MLASYIAKNKSFITEHYTLNLATAYVDGYEMLSNLLDKIEMKKKSSNKKKQNLFSVNVRNWICSIEDYTLDRHNTTIQSLSIPKEQTSTKFDFSKANIFLIKKLTIDLLSKWISGAWENFFY